MNTKRMIQAAGLAMALSMQTGALARDPVLFSSGTQLAARRMERLEIDNTTEGAASGEVERNLFRAFNGLVESADHPLIVSASALDEKAFATLDEDMSIMARILGKTVDRPSADESERKAMNIQLWTLGTGNRSARNMYVEGYGAIFILNVNMPLVAAQAKAPVEEKKERASSDWEEARSELYGADERDAKKTRNVSTKEKPATFDQAKFDLLKKNLTEALKNATHIRGLKENEYVTVVVQGPSMGSTEGLPVQFRASSNGGGPRAYYFSNPLTTATGPRSLFTLRAKKADIDAFAKGKMDAEDFRKKLTAASYQSTPSDVAKPK